MSIAISEEILDRTTKCTSGFSCLETGKCGDREICEVAYAAGDNVLILKSNETFNCSYRLPFGYGQICTCPTHYALRKQ